MFDKIKSCNLYTGTLKPIVKIDMTKDNDIRMTCTDKGSEKVIVAKDERYQSYHNVLKKETYYTDKDLSLKVGDSVIQDIKKLKTSRKTVSLLQLRIMLEMMNCEYQASLIEAEGDYSKQLLPNQKN